MTNRFINWQCDSCTTTVKRQIVNTASTLKKYFKGYRLIMLVEAIIWEQHHLCARFIWLLDLIAPICLPISVLNKTLKRNQPECCKWFGHLLHIVQINCTLPIYKPRQLKSITNKVMMKKFMFMALRLMKNHFEAEVEQNQCLASVDFAYS